ncbi:MAG: DUF465 domain-containing protein [Ahrensia sp.]|nr:DUF465 domain-containing protein [Ahrensia sp.]|tara:strand:+ start:5879 stop:6097 length:219 start_codon:yes stop_codon:yes gene_type:complete
MYARLDALRSRHGILESRIQGELQRPCPDSLRLTQLKRKKLRLREQIADIETAIFERGTEGAADTGRGAAPS